jgi:hypothetical protein
MHAGEKTGAGKKEEEEEEGKRNNSCDQCALHRLLYTRSTQSFLWRPHRCSKSQGTLESTE